MTRQQKRAALRVIARERLEKMADLTGVSRKIRRAIHRRAAASIQRTVPR